MQGVFWNCEFLRQIAAVLKEEQFTLIDVGCWGGLEVGWRVLGDKLRCVGFDTNFEECERLTASETLPSVRYVPAFVGLRPDHPFALLKAGKSHVDRNPWDRLSAKRSNEIRIGKAAPPPSAESVAFGTAVNARLADAARPLFLPEFFSAQCISDIDFIKLDVDGSDFEILHSLESTLADARVMGFGMEVNFIGSASSTDHTFHNTDRFMRGHGFDLFQLTVRPYSNAVLPGRYIWPNPAQTEFGRPLQGDALYVRDLSDPRNAELAASISPEKILKTAGIFALFSLPDCAAEILLTFRSRLADLCDIDSSLDTLAAQAQESMGSTGSPLSYKDYVRAFEQDSEMFYPKPKIPRQDTAGPTSPPIPSPLKGRSFLDRILGR
jgi:hypothetical protein